MEQPLQFSFYYSREIDRIVFVATIPKSSARGEGFTLSEAAMSAAKQYQQLLPKKTAPYV